MKRRKFIAHARIAAAAAPSLRVTAAVCSPASAIGDGDAVNAQLVVRDAAALTPADQVLRNELVQMGYTTTPVSDGAAVTAGSGTDLVVIGTSVDAVSLGAKYKNVAVPTVVLANASWTSMSLTAGNDGAPWTTANLIVIDRGHPIAAGLPTTFAPASDTTGLQSVDESYLVDGAEPVAARSGTASAHVVYSVSQGGVRGDETPAPANRAVLGLTAATLTTLTEDGLQLLRNALYWADPADSEFVLADTAPSTKAGSWQMNESSTATVMQDSSPNHNDGAIGSRVVTHVLAAGATGYRFPIAPTPVPDAARHRTQCRVPEPRQPAVQHQFACEVEPGR